MSKGTINFKDVKPHSGDQRRAFEEMCFQLFGKQFADKGEPVRREGSGGDAGMEGYIANAEGCEIVGLQAKYFPEKFGANQWRQIDESVRTALKHNSVNCSLKMFVVATPRLFNEHCLGMRCSGAGFPSRCLKESGSVPSKFLKPIR